MTDIKLTEFSHGAGCGCKISPAILDTILQTQIAFQPDEKLLVGNTNKDDAAVYDLGDGTGIISTTDFFMPIADDPFTFGRIAAANAISDIYAMGGNPMMAIAILGWPVNVLAPEIAQQVVEGGRDICREAGIILAGGHSIDSPEPIFGLAVTGRVSLEHLKRNDQAQAGDLLYLTKALGVGVLTTAQKQKKLQPEHAHIAIDSMCKLNVIGQQLASKDYVHAMTDVTGFGLAGHLLEMCQGAKLNAELVAERLPLLAQVEHYLAQGCIAGGSTRNFQSYGQHINVNEGRWQHLVCDPQTSGGLLVAVSPEQQANFEQDFAQHDLHLVGQFTEHSSKPRVKVVEA